MGNELTRSSHITMKEYIADFQTLAGIFADVWPDPQDRPPVYQPSTDVCDESVREFLLGTRDFLTAFTYHSYPDLDGTNSSRTLLDPEWLRNNILLNDRHAASYNCVKIWEE